MAGPTENPLSIRDIAWYWTNAGGAPSALVDAVSVALAESGGDYTAVSPSDDYGLWQINRINFAKYGLTTSTAKHAAESARVAVAMSSNGQNWAPWCTAWADPGPNCGHGHLAHPQAGSAAYPHEAAVAQALGSTPSAPGGTTGIIGPVPGGHPGGVTPQPTPPVHPIHADGVITGWDSFRDWVTTVVPTQYNRLDAVRQVIEGIYR